MGLVEYMGRERVLLGMQSGNKAEALKELSGLLSFGAPPLDRDVVFKSLQIREDLGSTGIGGEVAVPHAKHNELSELRIALAIHPAGVDFLALDQRPVRIFFAMLAPEGGNQAHLVSLARISRILRSLELRQALLSARTAEDAIRAVNAADV